MAKKHGLGRGLSSLIPQQQDGSQKTSTVSDDSAAKKQDKSTPQKKVIYTKKQEVKKPLSVKKPAVKDKANSSAGELNAQHIALSAIDVNSQQPRMYFDEEKLEELAASIREHGILQPLTVLVADGGRYELIAGERRMRAAKLAGLTEVPAVIREEMNEQKKLELAIIENVQRDDLNIIEEAKSYAKLAEDFNLSQEDIADKVGKSRSAVANRMRLTKRPIEIQRGLIDSVISEGHGKVILSLENPEKQRALYNVIVVKKLSVRDAESYVGSKDHTVGTSIKEVPTERSPQERILEEQLTAYFGTKVSVKGDASGGGDIKLKYYSQDELRTILAKLKF